MRRDALTLILCGAAAITAIAVADWAGPVPALLTFLILFLPLVALVLRPRRPLIRRPRSVTTVSVPTATKTTREAQANQDMNETPKESKEGNTEPAEAPQDGPEAIEDTTSCDLSGDLAEGEETSVDPVPVPTTEEAIVEQTVIPNGAKALEGMLQQAFQDAQDAQERPDEDEPERQRAAAKVTFADLNEDDLMDVLRALGDKRDQTPEAQAAPTPAFSWEDLESRLLSSTHPLRIIRREVKRIHEHQNTATPAERFFAQHVEDTGVFDKEVAQTALKAGLTSLSRSDLLYIRGVNSNIDHDCWLALISLEATLNVMRQASEHYGDLDRVSEADLYAFERRLQNRILAEAPLIDTADWTYLAMPWQFPAAPAEHGEWSCRHQFAEAIESLRLPWRLRARFHANVAEGTLAIEFDATPADALPKHAFAADLGIVPTTRASRDRDAAAYAARVGLLLAAQGFASSRRIKRVFVKATHDTSERHLCLFTAQFDRRTFSHLRLQGIGDPVATLSALGVDINAAEDGELLPVPERFHLGDETFCPRMRHDIMALRDRALPASAAHALGARRLLDLSIHEELGRVIAADDILRNSSTGEGAVSAERSVRTIMDVAAATSDLTVWDAASRVVRQIVEGRLSTDDAWALRDELVEGDDLTRALSRARDLCMEGDVDTAVRLIEGALAPLDRQGLYRDSESVAYRSFDNFTERVLYNRMSVDDTRVVSLVPDAYLIAHITLASLLLMEGMEDERQLRRSLAHVRRALDVAPLNTPATMLLSTVLDAAGDSDASSEVLSSYLVHAFHPQGIGYAYLKLAETAAEQGDERLAYSCYQMCLRSMPAFAPIVFAQSQALAEQGLIFPDDMGAREVQECLEAAGIPLAPTQHTFYSLFDGAIAATDAEVFPVARDMMTFIEALTGDDVMHAVRESLEREPDA